MFKSVKPGAHFLLVRMGDCAFVAQGEPAMVDSQFNAWLGLYSSTPDADDADESEQVIHMAAGRQH